MKYKLHFINQDIIWEVEGGSIADACTAAGICLPKPCGGLGTCGKCQVSIRRRLDGNYSKGKELEKVLACQTLVDGDMKIYVTADSDTADLNTMDFDAKPPSVSSFSEEEADADISIHPSIRKVFQPADELPLETGSLLKEQASLEIIRKYSLQCSASEYKGSTFVYYNDKLIDIQAGDTTDLLYGAAIDIGTTTVALYIYDLNTGKQLAVRSAWNRQALYGADVIARINYASQSEKHLQDMQKKILETICRMILQSGLAKQQLENLYHITVCGNSTMQHLFLGLNPSALGVSPFVSICQQSVCVSAKELLLSPTDTIPVAEHGVMEFLPLLGGFVGADTTAVLLTLLEKEKEIEKIRNRKKLESTDKTYLLADLGTNGEIALGSYKKGFLVASTACGPALEGGNISCGMRAETGAIDQIRLVEGELQLHWIGKEGSCGSDYMGAEKSAEPVGLCGSGLVDAMAVLLELGIIDLSGRMLTPDEYLEQYRQPPADYRSLQIFRKKRKYARKIREAEPGNPAFYFSTGEKPVYLSQKDIRQFQLAKSAIHAGCMALLAEAGITPQGMNSRIDGMVLAGAFGNYINLDHAISLGLLPHISPSKVYSIGNGAGEGVCKLLLQSDLREKAHSIAKHVQHVELAGHPVFMEQYVANMDFEPDKKCKKPEGNPADTD